MQLSHIRTGRFAIAVTAGALLSLALAGPAFAHAEIEVDPARAGATDAQITVLPEAHNHDAGVVSVQVYPPEGIAPDEVTLVNGPPGWELTTDDESYTLAGEELAVDVSPEHTIQVRQLPDEPEIHFRILVTYSDDQVDRWIEIPTADDPEPPNAAPGAQLAAAAAPATSAPATTPPPATPADASPTDDAAGADAAEDDGGTGPGLLIALIAAALVAVAAGVVLALRRRGTGPTGRAG